MRGLRAGARPVVIVFLATVALYLHTAWFEFAWDDKLVITANEYTTRGVAGLADIFTKRVSIPYKSEYRPVPQALHAIEWDLSGGSPAIGHAFNILWYALGAVMVYALVRFVFPRFDRLFAALVALLFAVHPLHVEVVANIKGRDEILALVFGLAGLMLLAAGVERRPLLRLPAGVLCFVIAGLSKANAITLLPLVALVVWYRQPAPALTRRLTTTLVTIGVCCVALVAVVRYFQSNVSTDLALHLNSTVLNNIFLWTTRPETVVPTALVNLARYAALCVFPYPLIHLYGYDQIPLSYWSDVTTWMVVAALAAVAVYVWRTFPRRSPVLFGLVWSGVTYSVYSNLWFYAPDTMADRYLFVPSVGLAVLAVHGLFRLAEVDPVAPTLHMPRARRVIAAFAVVLVAFSSRTIVASRDWRNDTTLIANRIGHMERNAAAQAIYGHTLVRQSYDEVEPEARRRLKSEAMKAFTQAIRIYPDFHAAWLSVGKLFAEQGIFDKAELAFIKAQRLAPLSPDGYFTLGTLYLSQQNAGLAEPYLEKAVLLDPRMEEAYVMLGRAYLQGGRLENLGSMIATARQWFPRNVDVMALQAVHFFRTERYAEAVALAKQVLAVSPDNLFAHSILSSPLAQQPTRPAPNGRERE